MTRKPLPITGLLASLSNDGEVEVRQALHKLWNSFDNAGEPHPPELRIAVETLDLHDPGGLEDLYESMDPMIVAHAVSVLASMLSNEMGWGRKLKWLRN
jgi:hypothetical protein